MKTLLPILTFTLATAGFNQIAQASPQVGAHWVCNQFDRATEQLMQRTVVLTQTDNQILSEGVEVAFELEQFVGAQVYTANPIKGKATIEDVSFTFISTDGSVEFHIYMDELNESSLHVNGRASGDFICR